MLLCQAAVLTDFNLREKQGKKKAILKAGGKGEKGGKYLPCLKQTWDRLEFRLVFPLPLIHCHEAVSEGGGGRVVN